MSGPSRVEQPLCQLGTVNTVAALKPGMSMGRVCNFRGNKSSHVSQVTAVGAMTAAKCVFLRADPGLLGGMQPVSVGYSSKIGVRSMWISGSATGVTMPGADVEVTSVYWPDWGVRKNRISRLVRSTIHNSGML